MQKKIKKLNKSNVTKYGEFVTTYFSWLPINKQKERAEELNKMTK